MYLSGFQLFFWATAFAAHLLLLAVIWRRGRAASFPVFTGLIAFYIARSVALFLIWRFVHQNTQSNYYYTALALAIVDEAIQLFVFYELATHVFCPTGVWAKDVKRAFVWIVAGSVLLATILTWLAAPEVKLSVQSLMLRSNFFSSALMSELFVGIMWLSATAGLPWKTHVARIAQGFGIYSIVSLILETINNYFGLQNSADVYNAANHVRSLVYLGCVGYWIVTLWQEAPAPRELPDAMLMQIYTLQRRVEYDLVRIRNWRRS
ncbi:MAG TPA: hypothetical protein VG714_05345 [Acidobacteriaceae bacterium]|nr:hypothetical protein [Acidobacteriaceae bacterium]